LLAYRAGKNKTNFIRKLISRWEDLKIISFEFLVLELLIRAVQGQTGIIDDKC